MLNFQFTPFPSLTSSRLHFRKVTLEDVPEIIALRGNKEVMKYINRPLITNVDEAKEYIDYQLTELKEQISIHWMILKLLALFDLTTSDVLTTEQKLAV